MPSVYVSTTVVSKLRLCDAFFAANNIESLDDLQQCPMFRKMDMAKYLKQLCVRSLRSKRSCMKSLVNTLCVHNHVFAQLFAQTKANYDKQHPPQPQQQHPRRITIRRPTTHPTTKKNAPCEPPPPKKPKRTREPQVKTPRNKMVKKIGVVEPKVQTQRKQKLQLTKDIQKQKEDVLPAQRRVISGGISYAQQQYTARDAVVYVGLQDFLQRERARLEIDIISLEHAIEYASRKMSTTCDVDELLHDVVHKLKLS